MGRFNLTPFRKIGWYGLIVLSLTVLLYYAWTKITSPWGNQTVAFQASAQQCGTAGALRYCVYRDAGGTNGDIVYHLHGRNLDEKIWNDNTYFTAMLQAQWQRLGAKPPTVVTISYGPTWLLTPKGQKPDSGLLEYCSRLPIKSRMMAGS
jgi:hypothetical protein